MDIKRFKLSFLVRCFLSFVLIVAGCLLMFSEMLSFAYIVMPDILASMAVVREIGFPEDLTVGSFQMTYYFGFLVAYIFPCLFVVLLFVFLHYNIYRWFWKKLIGWAGAICRRGVVSPDNQIEKGV